MRAIAAVRASKERMAELAKPAGSVMAMLTSSGLRIVKDYTDPTVVRKLNKGEMFSEFWKPVGEQR
jgi:hypothetical protein